MVIPLSDDLCPECGKTVGTPTAHGATDAYAAPRPVAKGLHFDNEDDWRAAVAKARAEVRFSTIWLCCWIGGAVASLVLLQVILLAGFVVIAAIAGIAGRVVDGRRCRRLLAYGQTKGWSEAAPASTTSAA